MYVIKELRLYGFKNVTLPSNRDLFSRVGKRISRDVGSDDTQPLTMDKMSSLEYMDDLDRSAQREEAYAAYKEEAEKRERERKATEEGTE